MGSNKSGFTAIEAVLLVLVLIIIGATGWYLIKSKHMADNYYQTSSNKQNNPTGKGMYILSGTVSEGPVTPGPCRAGQNCNNVPVTNHLMDFYNESGSLVVTDKTDSSGYYKVDLKPGVYSIKLDPNIGVSENSYAVTVGNGSTTFNISADTGIR